MPVGRRRRCARRRRLRAPAEELRVALLLLPGAALVAHRQTPLDQAPEHALDLLASRERMEPLAPRLELAGRLLAAQHEHAEQYELRRREVEGLVQQVTVL